MIQRMRIKFVALSMALLLGLLAVIMAIVDLINYRAVVTYSDTVIDILADNRGAFPGADKFDDLRREHPFSKEFPYETRYFTVRLDAEGNIIYTDTGKIAAVDTETAIYYAEKVRDGETTGFIGDYRYAIRSDKAGSLIIFLDCGRKLDDFYSFMWTNIWINLAGFAAVFVLIVILSKRIMRPFAENYEKQKLFITDAGHELKTPLTIIDADVDVLGIELGAENEWLQDIQKQTKRMTVMTNALVYLSRMEEADNHLQMVDFPISDMVAEAAQSFQTLAMTQGKTLELKIQPMLSFYGDAKAFHQLTSILLENAIKYSGEKGRILLSLYRKGNVLRLEVQNTSAPIPPEQLAHLFDRFYRTDKSRNTETGGFGIGLSIAKAIVTAHKGTIKASMPDPFSLLISVTLSG